MKRETGKRRRETHPSRKIALSFLGIISINLGIMNLLPVPVLDGGHIMFYLYEMVTGKKVSDAVMSRLVYVGMSLLLLLMVFAIFNDVYYN